MIVLDEQLLGRNLEREMDAWYPGAVCFITELRPQTVIKDDAIPSILRGQPQATFVTINATDFWEIVEISADFCVICLAIPYAQVNRVPTMIRCSLQSPALCHESVQDGLRDSRLNKHIGVLHLEPADD